MYSPMGYEINITNNCLNAVKPQSKKTSSYFSVQCGTFSSYGNRSQFSEQCGTFLFMDTDYSTP